MTIPTPAEIEERAQSDYEVHCASMIAKWRAGDGDGCFGFAKWNDPAPDGYWDAWRAAAREALIKETEYEQ